MSEPQAVIPLKKTLTRLEREMRAKADELRDAVGRSRYDYSYLQGVVDIEEWAHTIKTLRDKL